MTSQRLRENVTVNDLISAAYALSFLADARQEWLRYASIQ
jgi:hypothetical protein